MTYVTEQTSAELRMHMRSLKKMPGWHEPLADRLWREVESLQAALKECVEQNEACFANHYGENPEGGAIPEYIRRARALIGIG